jgi:hypothetical protein
MRFSKFVVPTLLAVALGAAAHADGGAHLDSFTATALSPAPMVKLCVTASGAAVGQPCFLTENGIQVASMILVEGPNCAAAPNMGPGAMFMAFGPGVDPMTATTGTENPGIN